MWINNQETNLIRNLQACSDVTILSVAVYLIEGSAVRILGFRIPVVEVTLRLLFSSPSSSLASSLPSR